LHDFLLILTCELIKLIFIGFIDAEELLVFNLTIVRMNDVHFKVAVKNEPLKLALEIEMNLMNLS
jgi:hypothetical protein